MKFIFWQNILSIHQSVFIRNLANQHNVYLVVDEGLDATRVRHGWTIPDFGKTEVIIKPKEEEIKELLAIKDVVNIFTGIDSFPLPARIFKIAITQKLKIGVILEPFNTLGLKGKLRSIKYKLLAFQYRNKIDFILAISDNAVRCYNKVGFNSKTIFDWAYFTEKGPTFKVVKSKRDKPKLLFVGSIDVRKNILPTVKEILHLEDKIDSFEIVGVGPLENELKGLIEKSGKIKYLGGIPNQLISKKIADADLLILPSIFDGWGAVVNEALQVGTPVLVSKSSGASCLINEERGRVFSNQSNNFREILNNYLEELPINESHRISIINWANESISAKTNSKYFIDIIENVYHNSKKPIASWFSNN